MEKAAEKGKILSVANKRLAQFSIQKQIDKEISGFKANPSVLKEYKNLDPRAFKSWMYGPNPLPTVTSTVGMTNGVLSDEQLRELHPEWYVDYDSAEGMAKIEARKVALQKRGDALPIALEPSSLNDLNGVNEQKAKIKSDLTRAGKTELIDTRKAIEEVGDTSEKSGKKQGGFLNGLKNLGKEAKSLIPKFNLLNRTLRIASTMLIRMGVKALFKGVKEGFNNFYQYSKATGGEFAKQWDGVFSSWNQIKNQMGAAIAPAISAAIPIINSLANAAITAFASVVPFLSGILIAM